MRKITLFSLLTLLIGFTSCSKTTTLHIDNPTAQAISISIDGKEAISIAPNETKEVPDLAQGEHTLKMDAGEDVKFTLTSSQALLNPTKARYFVYNEVYGTNAALSGNSFDKMLENGTLATAHQDLVIDLSDVDFKLNEVLPATIDMSTLKPTGTKSKIFRDTELASYFQSEGIENAQEFINVNILKLAPKTQETQEGA